jgi:hypothetical protein
MILFKFSWMLVLLVSDVLDFRTAKIYLSRDRYDVLCEMSDTRQKDLLCASRGVFFVTIFELSAAPRHISTVMIGAANLVFGGVARKTSLKTKAREPAAGKPKLQ